MPSEDDIVDDACSMLKWMHNGGTAQWKLLRVLPTLERFDVVASRTWWHTLSYLTRFQFHRVHNGVLTSPPTQPWDKLLFLQPHWLESIVLGQYNKKQKSFETVGCVYFSYVGSCPRTKSAVLCEPRFIKWHGICYTMEVPHRSATIALRILPTLLGCGWISSGTGNSNLRNSRLVVRQSP